MTWILKYKKDGYPIMYQVDFTANLFLEGYIIWLHNILTFDLQYIHIQQKLKLHLGQIT